MGEEPLAAAKRELAEEVGWAPAPGSRSLGCYSSAGFSDERVHLFHAYDLYEHRADSGEEERIEVVPWPLARVDDAIARCEDAKTLIGLQWLARRLNGTLHLQGATGERANS